MSEDNEPKTLAERLDQTQSGEEFGQVLTDFFAYLDATRHRGPGANTHSEETEEQ